MPDNNKVDNSTDDDNQKEQAEAEAEALAEHQKKLDQADELITIILPTINNN